jgi:hypothetical protein
MAKVKGGGSSNKGQKVSFTKQAKGKTTIGGKPQSIKFSTMNKDKRRNYKPSRGQGHP